MIGTQIKEAAWEKIGRGFLKDKMSGLRLGQQGAAQCFVPLREVTRRNDDAKACCKGETERQKVGGNKSNQEILLFLCGVCFCSFNNPTLGVFPQ